MHKNLKRFLAFRVSDWVGPWVRPENLNFWQVPWRCWCFWWGDHTLSTTDGRVSHMTSNISNIPLSVHTPSTTIKLIDLRPHASTFLYFLGKRTWKLGCNGFGTTENSWEVQWQPKRLMVVGAKGSFKEATLTLSIFHSLHWKTPFIYPRAESRIHYSLNVWHNLEML